MKKIIDTIFEKPVGSIFDINDLKQITKTLKSKKTLTRGKEVQVFENKFSKFVNCKYAFAVSSCSAALEISSKVLGLKKNDEVLVQSNSFWTAINHLLKIGVKIKCLDIDNENLNVSIEDIKNKVSSKTKAIYIMHHGGVPIDTKKIRSILNFQIPIVEDCAHALGSFKSKVQVGSESDLACFSFSSLKNISTLGEGGMIVTKNKAYAKKIKLLRDGQSIYNYKKVKSKMNSKILSSNKYFMPISNNLKKKIISIENIGSTYRMSSVQASVGISQLQKIKILNKERNFIADAYKKFLQKYSFIKLINISTKDYSSYHLFNFFIVTNDKFLRNKINDLLVKKYGIHIKLRFSPISWYPEMEYLNKCHPVGCRKCKSLKNINDTWLHKQMSLPIHPKMSIQELKYIKKSMEEIFKKLNIN